MKETFPEDKNKSSLPPSKEQPEGVDEEEQEELHCGECGSHLILNDNNFPRNR